MARTVKEPKLLKIKFGGGLHSRASEEDIHELECANGENFALDADNQQFRPRKPFDKILTAPNASEIRGGATLLKSDGTISTLIQAGDTVYEWAGGTTLTSVASVNASSKLRGRLEHNWQLTDKVLITDLALVDSVKEWDGTTFQNATFTDEEGYAFGTLRARYCYVVNERAVFANVHSNGTNTPNLIVGSQRGDYTIITIVNRPSSAASAQDPYFLVQPDNQYINGIVEAFGTTIFSSKLGSLYKLDGSDSTDFSMSPLLTRGGSSSDEALQTAINDIVLGTQGRIKSVSATINFGDVSGYDLSFWISDEVETYDDWLVASNHRLQRTYFHPVGQSVVYVLHHEIMGATLKTSVKDKNSISPWSKWKTNHELSFNPTFMMNMLDPSDGLEYVFMGDSSGNFYRMEGSGTGDGGTTAVAAFRDSKLYSATTEGKVFDFEGYVRYRQKSEITASVKFLYSGDHVFNETVNLTIPGPTYSPVYGTTAYYGTQYYYGTNEGFILRQPIVVAGGSNDFQVRVSVEDTDDWEINEVGLRFEESN